MDANRFAYEQVQKLYGDSEKLKELVESRMPKEAIKDEVYGEVYARIDEKC